MGELEDHVRCICSPDCFIESEWLGYLIASNPESVFEVAFISLNAHLSLPSHIQPRWRRTNILFLHQLIISLPLSILDTIVSCHA